TFGDFNIVQVLTRGGPVNTTHLFATLAYQVGLSGGISGREPPSRCSSSRCSPSWCSSSSATCGRSSRGHRAEPRGTHPFERVRLREPRALRLLRALPLLFHDRDVVQVERRAVQPQVHSLLDPERHHLGSLRAPLPKDRLPHLDEEQPARGGCGHPPFPPHFHPPHLPPPP